MSVKISESRYKDQPAISLESPHITAQFLPAIGAKLCSLVYKPRGFELLAQRPNLHYRVAAYDGDFVAQGECAGLDDMFPTIDKCFYEGQPWHGTPIPDHGEVWSIPWDVAVESGRLHFATYGVRFPYKLEKWLACQDDSTLHADYRVTNLSNFDFDFLWAAHPMFTLEEGANLALPDGVQRIVTVFSTNNSLGGYGDEFAWPLATLPDGSRRDLRQIRPQEVRDTAKYYIKGKMPQGWCALTYPKSNLTLTLSFPVEQVPYLAILSNEGGWQDMYDIFLEPATASFDRPDVARLRNESSTVKARATYEWSLDIALAEGVAPQG
jgi:hypothetical protein